MNDVLHTHRHYYQSGGNSQRQNCRLQRRGARICGDFPSDRRHNRERIMPAKYTSQHIILCGNIFAPPTRTVSCTLTILYRSWCTSYPAAICLYCIRTVIITTTVIPLHLPWFNTNVYTSIIFRYLRINNK